MTKARNLKRGDDFNMMTPMRVLSVETVGRGLIKVGAETENSPSLEFTDAGCVLEFICKSYRPFNGPYRGGWDDDDDGDDDAPDLNPTSPADLEDA
jgi:hypothetical protein